MLLDGLETITLEMGIRHEPMPVVLHLWSEVRDTNISVTLVSSLN